MTTLAFAKGKRNCSITFKKKLHNKIFYLLFTLEVLCYIHYETLYPEFRIPMNDLLMIREHLGIISKRKSNLYLFADD